MVLCPFYETALLGAKTGERSAQHSVWRVFCNYVAALRRSSFEKFDDGLRLPQNSAFLFSFCLLFLQFAFASLLFLAISLAHYCSNKPSSLRSTLRKRTRVHTRSGRRKSRRKSEKRQGSDLFKVRALRFDPVTGEQLPVYGSDLDVIHDSKEHCFMQRKPFTDRLVTSQTHHSSDNDSPPITRPTASASLFGGTEDAAVDLVSDRILGAAVRMPVGFGGDSHSDYSGVDDSPQQMGSGIEDFGTKSYAPLKGAQQCQVESDTDSSGFGGDDYSSGDESRKSQSFRYLLTEFGAKSFIGDRNSALKCKLSFLSALFFTAFLLVHNTVAFFIPANCDFVAQSLLLSLYTAFVWLYAGHWQPAALSADTCDIFTDIGESAKSTVLRAGNGLSERFQRQNVTEYVSSANSCFVALLAFASMLPLLFWNADLDATHKYPPRIRVGGRHSADWKIALQIAAAWIFDLLAMALLICSLYLICKLTLLMKPSKLLYSAPSEPRLVEVAFWFSLWCAALLLPFASCALLCGLLRAEGSHGANGVANASALLLCVGFSALLRAVQLYTLLAMMCFTSLMNATVNAHIAFCMQFVLYFAVFYDANGSGNSREPHGIWLLPFVSSVLALVHLYLNAKYSNRKWESCKLRWKRCGVWRNERSQRSQKRLAKRSVSSTGSRRRKRSRRETVESVLSVLTVDFSDTDADDDWDEADASFALPSPHSYLPQTEKTGVSDFKPKRKRLPVGGNASLLINC